VDLGVSNLAVFSTGDRVPNPRHLDTAMRRLRSASRALSRRAGPDYRRGIRASKRWERARSRSSSARPR
jgi:putative transposase